MCPPVCLFCVRAERGRIKKKKKYLKVKNVLEVKVTVDVRLLVHEYRSIFRSADVLLLVASPGVLELPRYNRTG